jgi:hypothetical protein
MGFFDLFRRKKPGIPPELKRTFNQVTMLAFPGGHAQIEEETGSLHDLLGGRLSRAEAQLLLTSTKALLVISEDKSAECITPSIINFAEGKLTPQDASRVYRFLTGVSGDLYSGGDGTSPDQAVVINATVSSVGVTAEYAWIEQTYGARDKDWTVESRSHGTAQDGRIFETFLIKLRDGSVRKVVFDISAFFGRFQSETMNQGKDLSLDEMESKCMARAFPGGDSQMAQETDELLALLGFRFSKGDTTKLLQMAKLFVIMSPDKSKPWVTSSFIEISNRKLNGQLSQEEAELVYQYVTSVLNEAGAHDSGDHYGDRPTGEDEANPETEDALQETMEMAFPNGLAQVERETDRLHCAFSEQLTREEAKVVLTMGKVSFCLAPDQGVESLIPLLIAFSNRKLNPGTATLAYVFISEFPNGQTPGGYEFEPLMYSGGDGSSPGEAVVIHAGSTFGGVPAEYEWIEEYHGVKDVDWSLGRRSHAATEDGRHLETFEITLRDGSTQSITFDITSFFGQLGS